MGEVSVAVPPHCDENLYHIGSVKPGSVHTGRPLGADLCADAYADALARPLHIRVADQLHGQWLAMLACLAFVLAIATPGGRLPRPDGWLLLASYPLIAWLVLA